jgi:hypothetical protein
MFRTLLVAAVVGAASLQMAHRRTPTPRVTTSHCFRALGASGSAKTAALVALGYLSCPLRTEGYTTDLIASPLVSSSSPPISLSLAKDIALGAEFKLC